MDRWTTESKSRARISANALASSHLLSTCATFGAIAMFVFTASRALSPSLSGSASGSESSHSLVTMVLLNVALIIFAWRRSSALSTALAANAEAEARAHESAFSDHVTGLSNRRRLSMVIEDAALRSEDATLLLLDLDHFKKVNDLYGHAAGDRLLRFVGDTLRELGPGDACCARLGGDEFGVLLPANVTHEQACLLAQNIVTTLSRPIRLDDTTAYISASIGLSTLQGRVSTAEGLLRRSDIAMYEAKRLGRNCWVWFDREMERELDRRVRLESEMRSGIAKGEFVPFYQPQYNLATGKLKGFEALARWIHPERGVLEPIEFIEIAEATGLISSLSLTVMRQALTETRNWAGEVTIAVNISPVQFRDPLLAQRILKILTETAFPPDRLELEITESAILESHDQALDTVKSLKNSGISISLDDFGTGYASLTQLKSLPFDRIKIDKSFVAALLSDVQSGAIVTTIAGLGKSLNLPVTAEGVESEDVRLRLEGLGCADGQGWLWGKAVPASIAEKLLGLTVGQGDKSCADPQEFAVDAQSGERRDHCRRPSRSTRPAAADSGSTLSRSVRK